MANSLSFVITYEFHPIRTDMKKKSDIEVVEPVQETIGNDPEVQLELELDKKVEGDSPVASKVKETPVAPKAEEHHSKEVGEILFAVWRKENELSLTIARKGLAEVVFVNNLPECRYADHGLMFVGSDMVYTCNFVNNKILSREILEFLSPFFPELESLKSSLIK